MKDDMFDEMEELMGSKDDVDEKVDEPELKEEGFEEVSEEKVEEVSVGEKKVEKNKKVSAKKEKPTEADRIEADNLLEEVSEILDPCIRCGMCKSLCPVFKVLREEPVSPRGKVHILSEKILDKIIFQCTLCKGCEQKCPLNIKVCDAIVKAREAMVLKGRGLKSNEEMIENVRKHDNPFGKGEINPDKLYCC